MVRRLQNIVKGFGGDAFLALVSTASDSFYQWVMLIAISKFCGIDVLGHYLFATALFIPMFRGFSFSQREISAGNFTIEPNVIESFQIRIWSSAIAFILSIIILCSVERSSFILIILWTFIKYVDSIFDLVAGIYQRNKNYKRMALSSIMRNAILPLGTAGLMLGGVDPIWAFTAHGALISLILLFLDLPKMRAYAAAQCDPAAPVRTGAALRLPSRNQIKILWELAGPLTAALFIATLNIAAARLSGRILFQPEQVGLIGGFMQLGNIFMPLITGITQAALPRLGRAYAAKDVVQFGKISFALFLLAEACAAVILFLALLPARDEALRLFFNPAFAAAADLLFPVAIGAFVAYFNAAMGPVKMAQLQYKNEFVQNIVTLIVLMTATLTLGAWYGTAGLLWGVVLSQTFRSIWLYITIRSGMTSFKA
ncbi:hypothetical protein [Magnetospirillum fulvum]|uniref:Polysaccharide biosynthesis protein n=1 Tax=Magnetospirillum fulvum MGU-K5 TaxID=1316936 RepID=S9TVQ5_MAGFU|nr:hypothetical protein [Magnetospirillum fulvum]EPY02515.1 polysaccharide biosynthesis protein [Magnetospirillum fulvum MGU-K5]